jgi:hypothetical protein
MGLCTKSLFFRLLLEQLTDFWNKWHFWCKASQWHKDYPDLAKSMQGKHHSTASRMKMSLKRRKENHWNWQGGITPINELERKRDEYVNWRTLVFERDDYTCQKCGLRGSKVYLNAHHILPFSSYIKVRLLLNNGVTLCKKCHEIINQAECYGHPFRGNQYVTANKIKFN